jgi:hypothetical protein
MIKITKKTVANQHTTSSKTTTAVFIFGIKVYVKFEERVV